MRLAFVVLPCAYATIITIRTTITTVASQTPASAQYTSSPSFQRAILDTHNFYRKEHNASALAWNTTSAAYAADWAAACVFEHSGGPTGENLAAGYPNVSASVDAWGTERNVYNFERGEFSKKTGHFTQLVWKETTTVGCGRRECNGRGGSPGWYVVCEYYPPGNVIGSFKENVQEQIEGVKGGNSEGVVEGAAGRLKRRLSVLVGGFIAAGLMLL